LSVTAHINHYVVAGGWRYTNNKQATMRAMKAKVGNALFYFGLLLALFALILQRPSFVTINGYSVQNWVLMTVLGFALALCGIVLVRKARSIG
jgi:hypothetical protein